MMISILMVAFLASWGGLDLLIRVVKFLAFWSVLRQKDTGSNSGFPPIGAEKLRPTVPPNPPKGGSSIIPPKVNRL